MKQPDTIQKIHLYSQSYRRMRDTVDKESRLWKRFVYNAFGKGRLEGGDDNYLLKILCCNLPCALSLLHQGTGERTFSQRKIALMRLTWLVVGRNSQSIAEALAESFSGVRGSYSVKHLSLPRIEREIRSAIFDRP